MEVTPVKKVKRSRETETREAPISGAIIEEPATPSDGGRGEGYPVTPQVTEVTFISPQDNNNDNQNNNNNNSNMVVQSPSSSEESVEELAPERSNQSRGELARAASGGLVGDRHRARSPIAFVHASAGGTQRVERSRPSTVNPQLPAELVNRTLDSSVSVPLSFLPSVVTTVPKESVSFQTMPVPRSHSEPSTSRRGVVVEEVGVDPVPTPLPTHPHVTLPRSSRTAGVVQPSDVAPVLDRVQNAPAFQNPVQYRSAEQYMNAAPVQSSYSDRVSETWVDPTVDFNHHSTQTPHSFDTVAGTSYASHINSSILKHRDSRVHFTDNAEQRLGSVTSHSLAENDDDSGDDPEDVSEGQENPVGDE